MSTLITYKIVTDHNDKLKTTAKIACNFWNRFVIPASPIVIRLGVFWDPGTVIARAYVPYTNLGVLYGRVEFNTKYLDQYSDYDIAGTLIHEIGHTLGIGWDAWMALFDMQTGRFTQAAIAAVPELAEMRVETEYGDGTRYSHWDEETFDKELMTGFKDRAEHVLPVTIKVMSLLGHGIASELPCQTPLADLMREVETVQFTRSVDVLKLDKEHFQETGLWEEVFAGPPAA